MHIKKKTKQKIMIVLFVLAIFLIQTPPRSYSKYYSIVSSENPGKIAAYVFLSPANIDVPIIIEEKLYPGITYEYPFVIKNYDDNIRCKVDLVYSLNISKTDNLPIEMKLYKDDVLIENNKIENQELKFSVDTAHNYKIVITWDETLDDYKYAGISDDINLYIDVVQVD